MEFIQSKIYPDLYLIRNPVKDKDSLNKSIKDKVIQLSNNQFKSKDIPREIQSYTLRFYEYNKGDWGEYGTPYFIEHKEKPEGMFPELLEYYPEFLLARFSVQNCEKDTSSYYGKLEYYTDARIIKTDTLFNFCKK
ncbi:hypothetical protein [Aquimarina sp. 2201CG14-23]|uniref:hypothetical protein n=1 Tax=Aquimarina mycalae TaxID=3040073 RepID=UPI00247815BA|nr:hypothetical protein [Aquimarina sp. 2201CG14-23]